MSGEARTEVSGAPGTDARGETGTRAGPRPLFIGLTGPIGCGKSTVAGMLAEIGAAVIDADAAARQVTEPGSPALAEIRARFGDEIFDAAGLLDRAALARIVFADPAALTELERITHPRVREVIDRRQAEAIEADVPVIVLEAIKLVEAGLVERCDEVWLVECAPVTQRQRLTGRGMDRADAEQRIRAQSEGLADRLAERLETQLADPARLRRISTEGMPEETRGRVEDALAEAFGG